MFERYAVYYTPEGELATIGARWLGWDARRGAAAAHPDLPGEDIAALTATPRKYGLHGTIKPPFVLADGVSPDDLAEALGALCATLPPAGMDGLALRNLAGFLALVPTGDTADLAALAATVVKTLDPFRAPPTAAELARRRKAPLSPQQEAYLAEWGYPYVMDQFRFHITLTGRLDGDEPARLIPLIAPIFAPHLPTPFIVGSLTLSGQDQAGMFHEIHRYALTG